MPHKPNKKASGLSQRESIDIKKLLLRWAPLPIVIFTAFIYSNALKNGITYFDDDYYILQNPYIRDLSLHGLKNIFTTFYSSNYHPLTTLCWALLFKFFGTEPLPYHLLNLLLHLLNIFLVFRITERLSGQRVSAIIVSLLFAVHPLHVESVAWISELKDVLYAAFYLSSLLAYLHFLQSGYRTKFYIIALLLFITSLFSKSAAVTLPVLLIVVDIYKGRRISVRSVVEKIPFFLFALLFGILNLHAQGISNLSTYFGYVNRMFLFTSGLAFYIVKLVAPFGLCLEHYFPILHGKALPWEYYASVPFLLLAAWFVTRPSAHKKEIVFGVAFFLITISVMLQIIPVGAALVSERYTYIPYIGLFYIIGQFMAIFVKKERWGNIVTGAFAATIILFSVLTWQRVNIWKNSDTLFSDVIEKNPGNGNVCFVLWSWGNAKTHKGDFRDAVEYYTQSLLYNPKFDRAYCSRGEVYDAAGNPKAAIQDYDSAIHLSPEVSDPYTDRGWARYESGDTQSAMHDYDKALKLDAYNYLDKHAETYNDRGWAFYGIGDTQAAFRDFNEAISLNPYFSRPYFNIATIQSNKGDINGAIEDYNKVLDHAPRDQAALCLRGLARFKLKQNNGACDDWNKAADLGNDWALQMLRQYCK